jgi:hypothetical protein
MCLQFGFVIFWEKGFGAKGAHKMLVKLTPECKQNMMSLREQASSAKMTSIGGG